MNKKNGMILLMSACTILTLPACETAKEKMGLTRHTPDEFMVMKRAPLEMPDDMKSLPKPRPGLSRPQEVEATLQAKQAIMGGEVTKSVTPSGAEQKLLAKAGAQNTNNDIRTIVNKEAVDGEKDTRPVIKKLLNIGDDTPAATILDPTKEAERIQNNKKAGSPVTTGKTPTLQE
ncbi:MAG: DUF3035 domain-containing protein [Alphaproteobacteria bacterium]|nr:DUF3035 domain-containing protein [Alphaproteobacteria bacterium]